MMPENGRGRRGGRSHSHMHSWSGDSRSDLLLKGILDETKVQTPPPLASLYHLEHSLYYVLCKILLLKSRKSKQMQYFLHRVNLHLPGRVSFLSTGLTGSRTNPENWHYLVENIPTVEDINKENLLRYPGWLLC